MIDHYTENNVRYTWELAHDVRSLYGSPVIPASLTPNGRILTLRNEKGEELTLRGEDYEDRIVFFHVEGGGYEIGAWVRMADSEQMRQAHQRSVRLIAETEKPTDEPPWPKKLARMRMEWGK